MSWFNESFANIKGQITNLAADLLTEEEGENSSGLSKEKRELQDAHLKIVELQKLCAKQELEIDGLKKVNHDLLKPEPALAKSTSSNQNEFPPQTVILPTQPPIVEDSWFWEPADSSSSSSNLAMSVISEKDESNKKSTDSRETERNRKELDHTEQQQRIKELEMEIELLLKKNNDSEVDKRCHELEKQNDTLIRQNQELNVKLMQLDKDYEENMVKLISIKEQAQRECNQMKIELTQITSEMEKLKTESKEDARKPESMSGKTSESSEDKDYEILSHDDKLTEKLIELSDENARFKDACIKILRKFDGNSENDDNSVFKNNLDGLVEDLTEKIDGILFKSNHIADNNFQLITEIDELRSDNEDLMNKLMEEKRKIDDESKREVKNIISGMIEDDDDDKMEFVDLLDKFYQCIEEIVEKNNDSNSEKNDSTNVQLVKSELKQYLNSKKTLKTLEIFLKPLDIDLGNLSDAEMKINVISGRLNEMVELRAETINKQKDVDSLKKKCEFLNNEFLKLNQNLAFYKNQCDELQVKNDKLSADLNALRSDVTLQTISESNEDNVIVLESQIDELTKKINDFEVSIGNLHEEVTNKDMEINQAKLLNQTIAQKNQEFQTQLANANVHIQELEKLVSNLKITSDVENNEINEDVLLLKTHLDQVEADNRQLREEIERKNQSMQELTAEVEKLSRIEKSNEDELVIRNLREQLNAVDGMFEGVKKSYAEKIDEMTNVIGQLTDQLEEFKRENADKTEEIRKKSEEISVEKRRLSELTQQNATLQDQVSQLTASNQQLANQQQQLTAQCHVLSQNLFEEQQALQTYLSNQLQTKTDTNDQKQKLELFETQSNHLNQLNEQIEKLTEENRSLSEKYSQSVRTIENLQATVDQMDEIKRGNEKLADENNFLKEKCDIVTRNLLEEQSKMHEFAQVHVNCVETISGLGREVSRLRVHLQDVEDNYTQELLKAEEKVQNAVTKAAELEQRERENVTNYTSAKIRANQQLETLQNQLQLITQQRDQLQVSVSDLEDRNNKNSASLTNLQCVLEQFQKDKNNEIDSEKRKITRQMEEERRVLNEEMANLKTQLAESKQGLSAASRLQEQLEKTKQQVFKLKDEVKYWQDRVQEMETVYKDVTTQAEQKVDKALMKNLVIGYVTSSQTDTKQQILKLISTVLDFKKGDLDQININKQNSTWLASLLHPGASHDPNENESLSLAFVRFLQNESQPKAPVPVFSERINERRESIDSSKSAASLRSSLDGAQAPAMMMSDILLPSFNDLNSNRGSILKDILKDNK